MNDALTLPLTLATRFASLALFEGFIIFLRVGAAMAALPAFGEISVPMRVRLGLAIAFTLVILPATRNEIAPIVAQRVLIAPYILVEPAIGLALGLVLRVFVHSLQIAGAMIAQATSLAQIFGNAGPEPQPAVGHLLTLGGLTLAVMSGLHLRLAEALILSYRVLPAGNLPAAGDMLGWGLGHVAQAFALGFSLAGPFLVAGLLYNVALGVINKAMPQLMVAMIGAPALTAGALLLLLVTLPLILSVWRDGLLGLLANPFTVPP